jgi:glycosyltransferase involved in cell wall biosynthesis
MAILYMYKNLSSFKISYVKPEKENKSFLAASLELHKILQAMTSPMTIIVDKNLEILYYTAKVFANGMCNPLINFTFPNIEIFPTDFKSLINYEARLFVYLTLNKPQNPSLIRNLKLSICLPTFNRIDELRVVIDRLFRQTDSNFELIVVNDGSTQNEVIKFHNELKEKYFSNNQKWKWFDEKNNYLGAARHFAALKSEGHQLLFIDDDNIPELNMVETYRHYWNHGQDQVLVSPFRIFYESSPEYRPLWFPFTDPLYSGYLYNIFADAQCLIDKNLYMSLGGYTHDKGIGFEDWELYLKLYLKGIKIFTIPEITYNYRIKASKTSMRSTTSNSLNHHRALRVVQDAFPKLKNSALFNVGLYWAKYEK